MPVLRRRGRSLKTRRNLDDQHANVIGGPSDGEWRRRADSAAAPARLLLRGPAQHRGSLRPGRAGSRGAAGRDRAVDRRRCRVRVRVEGRSPEQLVDYIVERYHVPLREDIPRLRDLAVRVEKRHAGKPDCPAGLALHLQGMQQAIEIHLAKEEQILFPMIRAGRGHLAQMPVQVMMQEHDDHGKACTASGSSRRTCVCRGRLQQLARAVRRAARSRAAS